jgi:hypothetical protein
MRTQLVHMDDNEHVNTSVRPRPSAMRPRRGWFQYIQAKAVRRTTSASEMIVVEGV